MKLNFIINKPINEVFNYLTDMQKFVSVHPVITKIDNLGNNQYIAHETLKIGFIPISFTYPFNVDKNVSGQTIDMYATVMKVIQISIEFKLISKNGSTTVDETIQFKTFLPIKLVLSKIFRSQHEELFKNIEN